MPPSPSLSRISNRSSDSWGSGSLLVKRVLVGYRELRRDGSAGHASSSGPTRAATRAILTASGPDARRPAAPARGPPRRVSRRDRGDDPVRGHRERARLGSVARARPHGPVRAHRGVRRRRVRDGPARPRALPRPGVQLQDARRGHRLRRGRDQARPARRGVRSHRDTTRRRARGDPLAPRVAAQGALAVGGPAGLGARAGHGGRPAPAQPALARSSKAATSNRGCASTSSLSSTPPSTTSCASATREACGSRSTAGRSSGRGRPIAARRSSCACRGSGSPPRTGSSSGDPCRRPSTSRASRSAPSGR